MRKSLQTIPWRDIFLVAILILFDLAVHPLTLGPDRLVHDPAVYRLWDSNYLQGDWYTGMAVKSGIYLFYAKIVGAFQLFNLPEELWRQIVYIASLATLFYALIRIARLFTKNILVLPIIAILHMMIATGENAPIWLYGPFLQIDGGLAPRSIGVALSFLALLYVLRGSIIVSAFVLGVATLVHVSNSFVALTLFMLAWGSQSWITSKNSLKDRLRVIGRQAASAFGVYLLAGGWFALYVAGKSSGGIPDFPTEQFIWAWTYFRAPYMALPTIGQYWWIRLGAHVVAIVIGWLLLRRRVGAAAKQAIDLIAVIGLGSVVYFFLFYFFAFIRPWLPGFQFYSLRIVYFAYFAAYLFMGLSLVIVGRELIRILFKRFSIHAERYANGAVVLAIIIFLTIFGSLLEESFHRASMENIRASWFRLLDSSVVLRSRVPERSLIKPPAHATLQYLLSNSQPFLGPPNMSYSPQYFPNIVTFKSFGFTKEGLPEWLMRINDVTRGEIQNVYDAQKTSGHYKPFNVDWVSSYSKLTAEDVIGLAKKYDFRLFLTYQHVSYPFEQVQEDSDYRLYRVP